MKKAIKKILSFFFDAKHERLVLIGVPCLAIAIALAVILPSIDSIVKEAQSVNSASEVQTVVYPTVPLQTKAPAVKDLTVSPSPSPSISPEQHKTEVYLTGVSTENDLYIFVRDMSGKPISGTAFNINVTYPSGQSVTYQSQLDGGCYIVQLDAGIYTVSMEETEGYTVPATINCTVKDYVPFSAIEEIEDIVDIIDVAEVIDEVKVNEAEAPEEKVAEVISTQNSSELTGSIIYDQNGNITYSYDVKTDENGFILDLNGVPTDVVPDYDETGKLIGGLRKIGEYEFTPVDILNYDNTPIEGYDITAVPNRYENTIATGWQTDSGVVSYILDDGTKATGLKSIDGKIYYFDANGRKASQVGIDVSFYNGTINWSAVKSSGVDFVIIRVGGRGWGSGVLYDDSCFYNYLRGAKAVGLKTGIYFYSTATSRVEAVQEASVAIDRLGGTTLDFPIYIDMEYSGDYPGGRSDTLSTAERVEIIQAFCETVRNSGYLAGLYTGENFLNTNLNYASLSGYNIWMASYTKDNKLPKTTTYNMWQITDRARIAGINGNVDLNVIF